MTAVLAPKPVVTAEPVERVSIDEPQAPVVVTESVDSAEAVAPRPNYVAIYASSILAVSLLFFLGVGVPAAMAYGNATGWGLAAMCAFWGGPSFGTMAGSARVSAWLEANEEH